MQSTGAQIRGHLNIKARETLGTRYTVHVKMLPHDQHTQVEERLLDDVSVMVVTSNEVRAIVLRR